MRLWTSALVALLFVSAVPQPAAAVDLCRHYGICVPPSIPPGTGCTFNALVVRHCDGQLLLCTARYMGGGGGTPLNNLVWYCEAILA